MSYIVMTAKEWARRMEVIADYPRSTYRNCYPWNCLYFDGSRWYGDCVNIQKSLLNGRDVDDPGVNTWQSDLSNTGDVTEWGLLEQCSDISQDFSKLKEGEPRILYKEGHIGAYLGKEKRVAQGIVNCVECTPGWQDGIQYSYVGPSGERCYYKGGPYYGYWTHHGKPTKWVDYEEEKPMPEKRKIFKDVKEGDPGWKEIEFCKKEGIFKGFSDGTFRPDEPITRADIARVIYRIKK